MIKILAGATPRYRGNQVCLVKSGSDELEKGFSGMGGYGAVVGRRNFTANGALESLGDLNTLLGYTCVGEDPLRFFKRFQKNEIDMSLHEDQMTEDANLAAHPEVDEAMEIFCDAWRAG